MANFNILDIRVVHPDLRVCYEKVGNDVDFVSPRMLAHFKREVLFCTSQPIGYATILLQKVDIKGDGELLQVGGKYIPRQVLWSHWECFSARIACDMAHEAVNTEQFTNHCYGVIHYQEYQKALNTMYNIYRNVIVNMLTVRHCEVRLFSAYPRT